MSHLIATEQHPASDFCLPYVKDGGVIADNDLFVSPRDYDGPIVTRKELWSYYLYFNGDNAVGPMGYSLTLFQSLASAAGYDPVRGPGSSCLDAGASGKCVLPWGSGTKTVSSIVLVANGASFAAMSMIFTTIGSAGDYGSVGKWLLLVVTLICWAAQFASVTLTSASRWGLAMALYMISFISCGATFVFYAAILPRLARNTQHSRDLRERYDRGEISVEVYEREESLEMNRINNTSATHGYVGVTITLALNLSLLLPLQGNPKVNNYVLVLTTGYWVLVGIWWFIFQQPRPGPNLPKGENYLTIGWKQIWVPLKQHRKMPNTFIYMFAFFLLSDGFDTTITLVTICQNEKFTFSFLQNTYLGLVQAVTSAASTLGFWYIQRHWKVSTKKMFAVTNVATILIPLWGMIGMWTNKLGFHKAWEFWAYNVVFGLFQASHYAFSHTMIAELSPPGFDNMFFGFFGLSKCASSMIGPNVIQAIIDHSGNNWNGFPYLFAVCISASLVIWFAVDVQRGRRAAVQWAAEQRRGTAATYSDRVVKVSVACSKKG